MASPSDAAAADILALGLTEMQAILGDSAPRTTYERLLREAKGDVSAALNRFFDTGGGAYRVATAVLGTIAGVGLVLGVVGLVKLIIRVGHRAQIRREYHQGTLSFDGAVLRF